MGGFSMQANSLWYAAALAALLGWTSTASAQYGPAAGPYGYGPGAPYGIAAMGGGMGGGMGYAAYQPEAPPEAPGGIGCTDPACGCEGGYGGSCCDDCCSGWCHRINVFGEFLYLRPRNAEIAYAVPFNGNFAQNVPPQVVQIGPVAVLDPDYNEAFRAGFGFTLNECSSIVATYTNFESRTLDFVQVAGGGVDNPALWPLILHPFAFNAGQLTLDASGLMDLNFELIDVDYKGLIAYNCDYRVNYAVGVRYATLDQLVAATYLAGVNVNNVVSAVQFEGAGLKLGLEGEYYALNSQFFAYGKGYASLVGGEFRASYFSNSNVDPSIVDTSWSAGRLVGIYDLEAGIGWRNCCDTIRLSVGYTYSIWTNVVKNNEWINSVQQNNFVDQSDNFDGLLTFDGLTARAELLW
jgi:hypothetical protein